MFDEMNNYEESLRNNNKLTNEIKNQINIASNTFVADIQITSYKLAKMAGRESQTTFSTFVNKLSYTIAHASNYLKSNAALLNNNHNLPQIKFNQNTLNTVHNYNLNRNNINKNNKELRISHNKSIIKTASKK
ncbi:hypothetical protein U3516DRAFT_759047 [Neocallimastix sp. 'constans']